jgi:hypothetical protein
LRSCLSRLDNHLREFFPFGKLRVRMTISTGTALRMTIYFPLQLAAKCEDPAIGRVCLVLLTALIIRDGGKLLCQVFLSFKLFGWCGLGGNWGVEGLDKKTGVRGKKEQGREFCGRKGWGVEAGRGSSGSFDCVWRKERAKLRSG